jgi:hypothetical protein
VIGKIAGNAGIAVNVIHDINLARNGEWGELALDSPVGETAQNAVKVIQQVSKGDVTGAAWTHTKFAIPVIGIIDGFRTGQLTLDPREIEWRPWKW